MQKGAAPMFGKGGGAGPGFGKGNGFKGGGESTDSWSDTWDEPMDSNEDSWEQEDPSQGKGGPAVVKPPTWKGKGKEEPQENAAKGNQPCFGKGSQPCFGKGTQPCFGKGKKDQSTAEEPADKGGKGGPMTVSPPAFGKGNKNAKEAEQSPATVKPPASVVKPPGSAPTTVSPPGPKGNAKKGGGKQSNQDESWENAEEDNAEQEEESWNKDSWKDDSWEDGEDWQDEDGGEEWGEEDEDEEWGDEDGGEEGGWVWQADEEAEEDWGEGAEEEEGYEDDMQAEEEEGSAVLHFAPECFTKIIGRAGGAINKVRQESGAGVTIKKTARSVEVSIDGTPECVKIAKESVIGLAGMDPDPSLGEEEEEEDAIEECKMLIDISCLGALLGKGGENIKNVRSETGADVSVKQVQDQGKGKSKGKIDVFISGTHDQVELAKSMLAETIGPSFVDRTPGAEKKQQVIPAPPKAPPAQNQQNQQMALPTDGFGALTMHFDVQATGRIIGSGGENIRGLREKTGADIRVKKIWNDTKCECVITGKVPQVKAAMQGVIEATTRWDFAPEFRGFVTSDESGGGDKGKGKRRGGGGGDFVPMEKGLTGHIIGVAGKKLQEVKKQSGAEILISKFGLTLEFNISGNPQAVEKAKTLLEKNATDGEKRGWGNKNWTNERDPEEDEDEYKSFLPRQEAMKIIGRGGRTSKRIRYESGAHVVCDIDNEEDQGVPLRIAGTLKAVDAARSMVLDVLKSEGGGDEVDWEEESYIKVSQQEARRLIGKGGENVKRIKDQTKSRVTIDLGDKNEEVPVLVRIAGPMENVKSAQKIIVELLDGRRLDDILEEEQQNSWNNRRDDRRRSYGYDRNDRGKGKKGYSKGGKDRDRKGGKGKKGKGKKRRRDD